MSPIAFAFLAAFSGCSRSRTPPPATGLPNPGEAPARGAATPSPVPAATVQVLVVYGSEKKTWIEEQISTFNQAGVKLASGAGVAVVGKAMGSGEAVEEILAGRLHPAAFSPASTAYVALLNDRWLSRDGHTSPLVAAADSVVLSPLVIAIWRPMAEALGWPKRPIGWADIIKISRDPTGWASKGRPEWGRFKLGHTHPEFSSSGLLTVLAEAYAGAGKTRDLTAADLRAKKTRSFMQAIEGAIVHYGKSTGFFAERMVARGPSFLSAAVLYENLVVESSSPAAGSGGRAPDMPLVAIYPREGTFWADHPFCMLADAAFGTPEQKRGAEMFLAQLKGHDAQARALALGFRPADPALPTGPPIDEAHGVDAKQPQTLLAVPSVTTLQALLETWRDVKKPSDVTLIFDKSGSMNGQPLWEAKAGARAFLDNLTARDQASLVFFDDQIYPPIGPFPIAQGRAELLERIDGVVAGGGTSLYDAVAQAFDAMRVRVREDPDRIHALVVMTDGNDEGSRLSLEGLKARLPRGEEGAPVKIFTIAYGAAAQPAVLTAIAEAGDGSNSQGSVENIVQVYRDIASFF